MSSSDCGTTISVFLSQEGISIRININKDTTAGTVVSILLQRPAYEEIEEGDTYALALASDPSSKIDAEKKITEITSNSFLFRIGIRNVKIIHMDSNSENIIGLDLSATIKETLEFLESVEFKESKYDRRSIPEHIESVKHDLILITNTSLKLIPSNGIRMDFNRTLASYRVTSSDILLATITHANNLWTNIGVDGTHLPVIVNSPELNFTKAFKYCSTDVFGKVILDFLEKANVRESKWFYSLYLPVGDENQELMHHWTLAEFLLPFPARLVLKKKPRPPLKWFGSDPSKLPTAVDPSNGIEVPEILIMLKDMLTVLGGIETEGIFRLAGLESEMSILKGKIESGEPFHSLNPHSIATLMKRWYKDLPVRLLGEIAKRSKQLEDEELLQLENQLSRESYNLFNWMISLLLQVAEKGEQNKMDSKNCAIVWGPVMVGSSSDRALSLTDGSPMDSFEDTRLGITAVQLNMEHFMNSGTLPFGIPSPIKRELPPSSPSQEAAIIPPLVRGNSVVVREARKEKKRPTSLKIFNSIKFGNK